MIEWKYVLFSWNNSPEHIRKAVTLAREAGVDLIGFHPGYAPVGSRSRRHEFDSTLRRAERRSDGSMVVWFNDRARAL